MWYSHDAILSTTDDTVNINKTLSQLISLSSVSEVSRFPINQWGLSTEILRMNEEYSKATFSKNAN